MSLLQSRRIQYKDADVTAVADSGLAAAWTAYTPTVTSGTGTITTVGTHTGRTLKVGRVVFYRVAAAITTNGTGATSIRFTLPYTAAAFNYYGGGSETALTGQQLQGIVTASGALLSVYKPDFSYPGADGATIEASGVYEAVS